MKNNHQDFTKKLEDRLDGIREQVEDRIEGIRERVDTAREQISDSAEEVFDKGEEAWKDAVTLVKKHPGKALGLALIVGAAMGAILGSRRSRD